MLKTSIPKCEVKYNRGLKIYEAVNGHRIAQGDKQTCRLAALKHDSPAVHAEVMAIIANAEAMAIEGFDTQNIIDRTLDAGEIVARGAVLPPLDLMDEGGCMNEYARVQGRNVVPYVVSLNNDDDLQCDCPDYILKHAPYLPNGYKGCKHVIAVMIHDALTKLDAPEPEPVHPSASLDEFILRISQIRNFVQQIEAKAVIARNSLNPDEVKSFCKWLDQHRDGRAEVCNFHVALNPCRIIDEMRGI